MARTPPAVSERYLRWYANEYLKRYFTTRHHLAWLLKRRSQLCIRANGGDLAEAVAWIDKILDDLERMGALNDALFVNAKVRSLLRKGNSEALIRQKLGGLGVGGDSIKAIFSEIQEESGDPHFQAALNFARKRRIGPFRLDKREEHRESDLAKLGRHGFRYDLAKRILALEPDELDDPPF